MISTEQRRHLATSPITWKQQWLPWIILISCVVGTWCILDETQQNQAAPKGTAVQLKCSTPNQTEATWSFQSVGKYEGAIAVNNGTEVVPSLRDKYSIDVSSPNHVNLLFNASENTAGIYTCRRNRTDILGQGANFILIDKKPTCPYEVKGDNISAVCSISYIGLRTPHLEWVNGRGKLDKAFWRSSSTNVSLSVTVPFNRTDVYKCTVDFLPIQEITGMSQNTPDFTTFCTVPDPPTTTGARSTASVTTIKGQGKLGHAQENSTTPVHSSVISLHHYYRHFHHLCLCFATLISSVMSHKWLWQWQ